MIKYYLITNILILLIVLSKEERLREDWDLNSPCQPYIEKFSVAISKMTECAANFTSPPKVCTNCIDQYINFKELEYSIKNLNNVTSLDNTTCSQVVYGQYLLSYVKNMADSLTFQVWDNSRCDSCLIIKWNFEGGGSKILYDDKTIEFQNKIFAWRNCASNASSTEPNICKRCSKVFDNLFEYYWEIYSQPEDDFCVDVETTMNDTMNIWHNIWNCTDDSRNNRIYDSTMLLTSTSFFILSIVVFYVGSYIQTERKPGRLENYSARPPIQVPRSRLLSSSTYNDSNSEHSYVNPNFTSIITED
uniref:Osteopetrosis-associated transmembrane protein 1 (inferred by orthology to a human protein) n=1 Tax=Strongyloides venezuelensis TaxID=75913 RepID=A0A0K0EWX4_STRVS